MQITVKYVIFVLYLFLFKRYLLLLKIYKKYIGYAEKYSKEKTALIKTRFEDSYPRLK